MLTFVPGRSTDRGDHDDGGGAINGMGIDSRSEMSGSEFASSRHNNSPTRNRSSSRAPSVNSASAFSAHTTDVEIASTVDHNPHRHPQYRGRAHRAGSVDTVMQSEDNGQHTRNGSLLSKSGSTRNTLWNRSMNQLLSNREEVKEGVFFSPHLSVSQLSHHLIIPLFYRITTFCDH